jgi:hypothetical protein
MIRSRNLPSLGPGMPDVNRLHVFKIRLTHL